MENSINQTRATNQRLLPLHTEIIRLMAGFYTQYPPATGAADSDANSMDGKFDGLAFDISNEVRTAVFAALRHVPYLNKLMTEESLVKIVDNCLGTTRLLAPDPGELVATGVATSIEDIPRDSEAFDAVKKKKIINLRNWMMLKQNIERLKQSIASLESAILNVLDNIPEWKSLNINHLSIDIDSIIDKFTNLIEKALLDDLRVPSDVQLQSVIIQKLESQELPQKATAGEGEEDDEAGDGCDAGEGSGSEAQPNLAESSSTSQVSIYEKDVETIQIVVSSNGLPAPGPRFQEQQRLLYENIQYVLNTTYFLKSDTSLKLNKRNRFNIMKTPLFPFSPSTFPVSPYEENFIVQMMSRKCDEQKKILRHF